MAGFWNLCEYLLPCLRRERSYSVAIEMDSMERGEEIQVRAEGCCESVRRIWNGWSCATKVCVVATGCIITAGAVLSIGALASTALGSAVIAKGVTTQSPPQAGAMLAANTTPIYQKTNTVSSGTLNRILEIESGAIYRSTKATTQSKINLVSGKIDQPITDRVQMTTYRLKSAIANQQTEASTQPIINPVSSTIDRPITEKEQTISYSLQSATPNKQTDSATEVRTYTLSNTSLHPVTKTKTNKRIDKTDISKGATTSLTTYQDRLKEDLTSIKEIYQNTSWITKASLSRVVEFPSSTTGFDKIIKTNVVPTTQTQMRATKLSKRTLTTTKVTRFNDPTTVGTVAKKVTWDQSSDLCEITGEALGHKYKSKIALRSEINSAWFDSVMDSWVCRAIQKYWVRRHMPVAYNLFVDGQWKSQGYIKPENGYMLRNYTHYGLSCHYDDGYYGSGNVEWTLIREGAEQCRKLRGW